MRTTISSTGAWQLFENDFGKYGVAESGFHEALSEASRCGSSTDEEFGPGDGQDRLPEKAYGVHRQFSAQHSGSGRIQWRKHLNLLRVCQLIPAREIPVTWFTIGLLREL